MAYSTYLGELSYRLTLDKSSFDRGMADASRNIKTLDKDVGTADRQIKGFSRTAQTAGSSLASLGGVAIVSGAAIGGDLGGAVQSAGMGMAALGGTAHIAADALKLVSVAGTGMVTALGGPTAVLALSVAAIGMGAIAVAAKDAYGSTREFNREIKEQGKLFEDADKAMKDYLGYLDELKGIPKETGELEFQKRGLAIQMMEAGIALQAAQKGGKPLEIAAAKYDLETIERRILAIDAEIQALQARPAAMQGDITRAALQARGITTGEISAAPRGVWGYSEGVESTVPVIGSWLDRTFGKGGRVPEFRHSNAFDPYGVQANPLYNRTLPGVNQTYNITVQDAAQVRTIIEDSMTVADRMNQKGMI